MSLEPRIDIIAQNKGEDDDDEEPGSVFFIITLLLYRYYMIFEEKLYYNQETANHCKSVVVSLLLKLYTIIKISN